MVSLLHFSLITHITWNTSKHNYICKINNQLYLGNYVTLVMSLCLLLMDEAIELLCVHNVMLLNFYASLKIRFAYNFYYYILYRLWGTASINFNLINHLFWLSFVLLIRSIYLFFFRISRNEINTESFNEM